MISKLLKFNNKVISNIELLSFRHLSDYVSMKMIDEYDNFNLYLVHFRNDNFIIVKVVKDEQTRSN